MLNPFEVLTLAVAILTLAVTCWINGYLYGKSK